MVVGVVASPGAAAELAAGLLPQLDDRVAARLPGVRWVFRLVILSQPALSDDQESATAAHRGKDPR